MDSGLGNRIFDFVIKILRFTRELNYSIENKIIINQLLRATTSIGANYEESQGAASKADFRNKIKIALKEARETNYWLRILKELKVNEVHLDEILDESMQLMKILGKISSSSR